MIARMFSSMHTNNDNKKTKTKTTKKDTPKLCFHIHTRVLLIASQTIIDITQLHQALKFKILSNM